MSNSFAVGGGLPGRRVAGFDAGRVAAYAALSGDSNAIHLDLAAANRVGLAERPVQGMAIMALLEPYVLDWRPTLEIASMTVHFMRPVLIGTALDLSGRVAAVTGDGSEAILRLIVRDEEGQAVCVGEATVRSAG